MARKKLYTVGIKGRKVNVAIPVKNPLQGDSKYTNVFIGDGGYKTTDANEQWYLDNNPLYGLKNGFTGRFIESEPEQGEVTDAEETTDQTEDSSENEEATDTTEIEEDAELAEITTLNEARLYLIEKHGMSNLVSNPDTVKQKATELGVVFPNFTFPE